MKRSDWYAILATMNENIVRMRGEIMRLRARIADINREGAELDQAVDDLLMLERTLRPYQLTRQSLMEMLSVRYVMIKTPEEAEHAKSGN